MIEAVSSVVLNAPLVKGNLEQTSTSQIEATQVDLSSSVSDFPRAPFISPVVFVDTNFDTAVLQIRDSDTGDVLRQFPSESALEARNRAESARQLQQLSSSQETPSQQATVSSSAPSQQASSSPEASSVTTTSNISSDTAVQAQIASQALSTGAQTSQIQAATVAISA